MNKLGFYTRVHKKYVSLVVLYIIKTETLIYDHIAIVLALRAHYRTLLLIFFTNQYFFLNSNPEKHFFVNSSLFRLFVITKECLWTFIATGLAHYMMLKFLRIQNQIQK